MSAHRIPVTKNIPGDLILRGKGPASVERRSAQRVEGLLEKLRVVRGGFEGREQSLAQIQVESLPADAEQPAIETFPEAHPNLLFDHLPRQAIDLFDIPVVIAGALAPLRPSQEEFRAAEKKQICVQDQKFITWGEGHGIEKLKKEVMATPIAEAGGVVPQELPRRFVGFLPGHKSHPRKPCLDSLARARVNRSVLVDE